MQGSAEEVFSHADELEKIGVDLPMSLKYKRAIEEKFGISIPKATLSLEDLTHEVVQVLRKGGHESCKELIIGRYIPGNSLIHQLDPRTKSLIVFFICICCFLSK